MRPETKKRACLGVSVFALCAIVAVVSAVVARAAVLRNQRRGHPTGALVAPRAAALTEATLLLAPSLAPAGNAEPAPSGQAEGEQLSTKAAGQQGAVPRTESIYMLVPSDSLIVTGQDSPLALPYSGMGPCRQLHQLSNISLDLSSAVTGCRGLRCLISLRVTLPRRDTCSALPAPRPTVLLFGGEQAKRPLLACSSWVFLQ